MADKNFQMFGIKWSEDCVYEVRDRDNTYSTPEEKKRGFYKAPNPEVAENRSIGFKETASGHKDDNGRLLGVFETGFTTDCPVWQRISVNESRKKEIVKFLNDFIKKPYERRFNVSLSSTSDFWRTYTYPAHNGLVLSLNDEESRMWLYFMLLNGRATTEYNNKQPELHACPYRIVEYSTSYDDKEDFMLLKEDARQYVFGLLENDFEYLVSILKYINRLDGTLKADKDVVRRMLLRIFEGLDQQVEIEKFVGIINDEAQKPEGKEIIVATAHIRDMQAYNIIRREDQLLKYKGNILGASIQEAAFKLRGKDPNFDKFTIEEMYKDLKTEKEKRNK